MVDTNISKIVWCYSEDNALRSQNLVDTHQRKKITYHKGLPESFENETDVPTLIILDDLMMEADNNKICEVFTRGSHHRNQSIVMITQNIFFKGKHCRDISLNTKYIVVFKNPRDKTQFRYLAHQIYPENSKELLKIYKEVTDTPYNYLLLDLTQGVHDSVRFRTNIFNENYAVVYCSDRTANFENEEINSLPAFVIRFKKC